MAKIRCESGGTQIGRVLRHVSEEGGRGPVKALIYVETRSRRGWTGSVPRPARSGCWAPRVFMFHEGGDPMVASAFSEIARLTGGAALAFDTRAPSSLEALLRAVAAYATGGAMALTRLASRDGGARRLIAAMPAIAAMPSDDAPRRSRDRDPRLVGTEVLRRHQPCPPRQVSRTAGGVAAIGAAGLLMFRGRMDMAFLLGSGGAWLLGWNALPMPFRFGGSAAKRRPQSVSRVRSAGSR